VQDSNNLTLEVTPVASTTVILDRGIPGPMGDGDVDGPASSTDNALARFDGTTGKLIQNSIGILSDAGLLSGLTTVDTTNIEVTNVKAIDGTAAFAIANTTGVVSINDSKFTLQNNADTTKKAQFELSGLTTGTTFTYTLPTLTGTLATIGNLTQTFAGSTTFSNNVTFSGNNTLNFGTSQTSGIITTGGTSGTGNIVLGRSTVSQRTDIQAGATASGSTKTINFGIGGLAGSTTNIAIGSTAGTSTTTVNGNFAANLANSTGLPISTGVSGLGTGVATALAINVGTVGGFGDVIGPASSSDYGIPVFDGTTGKLLKSSVGVLSIGGELSGLNGVTAGQYSLYMPGSGGSYYTGPNSTTSGWAYTNVSKSISAEETAPTGLFFKPDGTKMYVSGSSGDDVNEYALSTPGDITTATFTALFSIAGQDTATTDLFFKPDGLTFYIVGDTNNAIFQYTLGTAWDITTASYASKTFSVASQETSPSGLWFKPDGLAMYVVGSATDTVYQYTLSTAWDVSTASYSGISVSVAAQDSTPSGLSFGDDGFSMFVLGSGTDQIYQYNLAFWGLAAAYLNSSFYVGFQDVTPTALFIGYGSGKAFVAGSTNDTIYEYNTQPISVYQDGASLLLKAYTRIENNAYIDGSAKIDGALTVDLNLNCGTITSTGNLVANQISTSTSAITLGNSVTTGATQLTVLQTSGAITVGGTAGTGAITVGQSTAAQTLNLATGATTTATTKTVNIGTAGVSGSTTNINIGSAVSGATSTTTLNGLVVDSISAAVSAAGATQATATLLTTTINNVTVVAAAADGVRLPTAVAGLRMLIRNSDAADALKIYPATGGQINALGTNASFSLAAGATIEIFASTTTQWYTF